MFLAIWAYLTINVLWEISTELHAMSFIYTYSSRKQIATGHHLTDPLRTTQLSVSPKKTRDCDWGTHNICWLLVKDDRYT